MLKPSTSTIQQREGTRKPIHNHSDRDEIRRRAADDFRALFVDLGGELRNRRPLCPFHKDSNPSASIDKGRLKCFGCGVSLDAIAFTARMLDTNFRGALRYLGDRYGVAVQEVKLSPRDAARYAREKRLRDRDLPIAELWLRAALKLTDEALTALKADLFDPLAEADPLEIQFLEVKRARLRRLRGGDLVGEYRSMLRRHPAIVSGLVRAARDRQEAERRALDRYWAERESREAVA